MGARLPLDVRVVRRYAAFVRIASGKVISGKVVLEGDPLPEGATVAVVALDDSEMFELDPSDEAALLAAIEEIRTGDTVEIEDIFKQIRPTP